MRCRGKGPRPCTLAIVGEGPGWQEDQCGWPFVGKTGEELDRHIQAIGLCREQVFLTNLYRDYHGKDYDYTAEDLAADLPDLLRELEQVRPATVVTLGRAATRWFLGDVGLGEVWGLPWTLPSDSPAAQYPFLAHVVVVPIHHPAAGMHNPEMSPYVVAGFEALGQYLAGDLPPRRLYDDPHEGTEDYREITDPQDIQIDPTQPIHIDTEGIPGAPWSIQYSQGAGTARLVRSTSPALAAFRQRYSRLVLPTTFHSALHEFAIYDELGLPLPTTFDDTMVMAYLLQIEDQGLKALCARHCGMRMDAYDDIIGDAGNRLAMEYLTWLWDSEYSAWEEACREEFERRKMEVWTDKAGKVRHGRRITTVPTLPKSALLKAVQRCLGSREPRRLWLKQVEDIQVAGYRQLGPLPEPTLDYVSRAQAVRYGCRDADGTGRLAPLLRRRITRLGLERVYQLELGTYPLIARMAKIGLKPDLDHFARFSATLQTEIDRLRAVLVEHTGNPAFNANSGDQVAAYLFDEMGLDGGKRTSGGRYSTNAKILEGLEHEYPELPVIGDIMAYREVYKLKNTFVDRLPDFVRRYPYDGRIHPTYRTTRVVTGRLAASDPNVLAQPEHGDFAKEYKRGWVAEAGHVLCSWDQCLVPGTRVLKSDLTWVSIETLQVGDALIGIEEEVTNGKERKTLTSTVVRTGQLRKMCYRMQLSNGRSIVASAEHPWLVKQRISGSNRYQWVETRNLRPRDQMSKFIEPWNVDTSYDAGWLAGFFDGEGSLSTSNGTMVLTQNAGPLMERAKGLLRARGYDFHVETPTLHPSGFKKSAHAEIIWMCGVRDCLHFLGTVRPQRLLAKAPGLWEGRISLKKKRGKQSPVDSSIVYVEHIEPVGEQDVVSMETSSHTFVAEGFHTHNSQVELRGLAHLSQDPVLLAVYRGELRNPDGSLIDLHAKLAQRIFGGKVEQYMHKCRERLAAKAINFGIPMGMTNKGLTVELRKNGVMADEDDAQRWLDDTLALYVGVAAYQRRMAEEAEQHGYIRCVSGRIRYIGGIRSRDERIRAEAERFAFSTPVQESAQFVMKQAEAQVWHHILLPWWRRGRWVEPLVQIHDALKMEVEEGLEQELHREMTQAMTEVPEGFSVPLAVEGEYGRTFADMEAFR